MANENIKNKTWELIDVATQTQKMFHNKETDETLDSEEILLRIMNDLHDLIISIGN